MRRYASAPAETARPAQLPTRSTLTHPTPTAPGPMVPITTLQPTRPTTEDPTHVAVTNLAPPPPTI